MAAAFEGYRIVHADNDIPVQFLQETAADYCRRKLDVQSMEAAAEKAAALTSMINEFSALHPIPQDVLREKILKEWARGSDRIEVELNAALLDKADTFEIAVHMPSFKALLDNHLVAAPVSSSTEASLRDALKQDEFDHTLKKLDYDIQVFKVWQSKCRSVTDAQEHARQENVLAAQVACKTAVETFVKGCEVLGLGRQKL